MASPTASSPLDPSVVYDVLVVGAGPCGLLAALGAAARGAQRVVVVDQARALGPAGSFLDLQPNALTAARAVCPRAADALAAEPSPRVAHAFHVVDTAGTHVDEIRRDRHAGPAITVRWSRLQEILLAALPDSVRVVVNHQLCDLRMASATGHAARDCVRAEFVRNRRRKNPYVQWAGGANDGDPGREATTATGGSVKSGAPAASDATSPAEVVSMFAKFVIGADGVNSVARRCVYRGVGEWHEFAEAEYSGQCMLTATGSPDVDPEMERRILDKYSKESSSISLVVPRVERSRVASPRLLMAEFPDGQMPFTWFFSFQAQVAEQMARFGPIDALADHVLAEQRKEGLSEDVIALSRRMLKDSTGTCDVSRFPLYVVPACHPPAYETLPTATEASHKKYATDFRRAWGWKRIALVGDAAHAMPPTLAQGTALGFEDVAELLPRVARTKVWDVGQSSCGKVERDIELAIEDYQKVRMERVCLAQARTVNRWSDHDIDAANKLREDLHAFKPSLE